MIDNEIIKVLLNVIQRIYDKNPEIQEVINVLLIETCAEEGVSPEQEYFYFALFFSVFFIIMSILEKNLNKNKKAGYGNYRGYIKKRAFLVVVILMFGFMDFNIDLENSQDSLYLY